VRDLEGLADANMDDTFLDDDSTRSPRASFDQTQDDNVQDGAVGGEGDGKVVKALSVLTVRFMPLIECYLSVCGATVLKLPEELRKACQKEQKEQKEKEGGTVQDGDNASSKNSAGEKRKAGHVNADAEETVTTAATEGKSDTGAAADAPALADTPRTRPPTTLLGARFRRHASYWLMQMELEEGPAARRLLRFTQRNRVLLNIILRHNVHLLESTFSPLVSVPRCRHLLHFDVKRAYFKMKLKRMRQNSRSLAGSLRINVRRHCVFEDSFHSLRSKSADDMRRKLSVTFHGEEGMDAGGLTREWYSVLAREIFNANYALFIATSDNVTFQPNSQSYVNPEHLAYFKFVGRVIGKAICDGQLLDAHFTRSFYKHILGQPVNYHDLEAIEPDYYKSLKQILEYPLDLLGVELTFSAESHDFGQHTTVDLIENGRNIAVTDETKSDYVQLIAHHRMTAAIRKQIDAFLEGFHELLPAELISIFDAQELELLISGLPDVDLDDLRAHTEYHGYKATDPVIEHFWSVLRSFSKEEKALFLQFVTGTSKVPLEGFQALIGAEGVKLFNIHKAYGTHLLPTAHTCFNQLDLPEYETEEDLREKILVAIREGSEGFGFA
jgi:E3 ubiquitin-protein ligase HUWE1